MKLTLATCWYSLKSKFDKDTYKKWMNNFLSKVKNFNLVIFTDDQSMEILPTELINENPRIMIIIKPLHTFCTWNKKEQWIKNHERNNLLNHHSRWNTDWQLNMIWNEKINFVNDIIQNEYFKSEWYGWCDIGYFRGNEVNVNQWPNLHRINCLKEEKIYYGLPGNRRDLNCLLRIIMNKNDLGLPKIPIPPNQVSIAGGFFLIHHQNIEWWYTKFYDRLHQYLDNEYLVKDDQIVIVDCILNNLKRFEIIEEKTPNKDKWFVFQSFLL